MFEEHLKWLSHVLQRVKDAGLMINRGKSELYRSEVMFLGVLVNRDGFKRLKTLTLRQLHLYAQGPRAPSLEEEADHVIIEELVDPPPLQRPAAIEARTTRPRLGAGTQEAPLVDTMIHAIVAQAAQAATTARAVSTAQAAGAAVVAAPAQQPWERPRRRLYLHRQDPNASPWTRSGFCSKPLSVRRERLHALLGGWKKRLSTG